MEVSRMRMSTSVSRWRTMMTASPIGSGSTDSRRVS